MLIGQEVLGFIILRLVLWKLDMNIYLKKHVMLDMVRFVLRRFGRSLQCQCIIIFFF